MLVDDMVVKMMLERVLAAQVISRGATLQEQWKIAHPGEAVPDIRDFFDRAIGEISRHVTYITVGLLGKVPSDPLP